jgi:hypothetical protein
MTRCVVCALALVAAALLACKQGDDGSAGAACKGDQDCKNGLLCESALCIPKQSAEQIRAAGAQPGAGTAPAPSAAADPEASGGRKAPDTERIPAIPGGRSAPPTLAEWSSAEEVNTQERNSQPDACETKVVREWLNVTCRGKVIGFEKMEGFGSKNADYFEMIKPGNLASFVLRMKEGKTQSVRICREKDRASLFVNWPGGKDRPVHIALGKGPICGS